MRNLLTYCGRMTAGRGIRHRCVSRLEQHPGTGQGARRYSEFQRVILHREHSAVIFDRAAGERLLDVPERELEAELLGSGRQVEGPYDQPALVLCQLHVHIRHAFRRDRHKLASGD